MNCSDIEKRLYCYRELDDRERAETDQHVETCAACREIMKTVSDTESAIEAWQKFTPTLPNEARMTSRIMEAIGKTQRRGTSQWRPFFQDQRIRSLRLAMAAASLFLVVFFLSESARDSGRPQLARQDASNGKQQIELNLASFHSAFFAEKKNIQHDKTSILECVRDCLQKRSDDCSDCADKYSKP